MGKRGEGIYTSSFYTSGYTRDRSKVKVWEVIAVGDPISAVLF